MLSWLEALVLALHGSGLRRAFPGQRGQTELFLILLIAFVIALLITGRRVVVQ